MDKIESLKNVIPFGAQYLERARIDCPGEVNKWSWQPSVPIHLTDPTASFPGTTGTGPTAKEEERYIEAG